MASSIKRRHEPPRIVGDLLQSEPLSGKRNRMTDYLTRLDFVILGDPPQRIRYASMQSTVAAL